MMTEEQKQIGLQIANTIWSQIKTGTAWNVWGSWGISKRQLVFKSGMFGLALRVSGAIHKGWVKIVLDEGADLYEISLENIHFVQKGETIKGVYFEDLGDIIDSLVERKPEWSDDQYKTAYMVHEKQKQRNSQH